MSLLRTTPSTTDPHWGRNAGQAIDSCTDWLASKLAWIPITMAMLTVVVVALRYLLGVGFIAGQEGVIYLHSTLFMLGASCAMRFDEHVRVDIFYRHWGQKGRAWVNALGHIVFTLPLCALIGVSSFDYVTEAWFSLEGSAEPGGLPAVFLLKTLIPVMALLLSLQAFAEIIRSIQPLLMPVQPADQKTGKAHG